MDAEERVTARPDRQPVHPGIFLRRQIMPALAEGGITKVAIAAALGIKRQSLYDLLNGKRTVTPDVATRLGRGFGNSPQFWMNMQANHDLWLAEQKPEIQNVIRIAAA